MDEKDEYDRVTLEIKNLKTYPSFLASPRSRGYVAPREALAATQHAAARPSLASGARGGVGARLVPGRWPLPCDVARCQ
jgi:hypothetical protein